MAKPKEIFPLAYKVTGIKMLAILILNRVTKAEDGMKNIDQNSSLPNKVN